MHAGGVADSATPWNDEKDPFEVFTALYLSFQIQWEDWFCLFLQLKGGRKKVTSFVKFNFLILMKLMKAKEWKTPHLISNNFE